MSHVKRLRLKVADRRYNQIKKTISPAAAANTSPTNLTEAALRESESFYRQMFEHNRAVKLVIDPSTAKIIEANQAACDFYGYTSEQFKTLRITDINVRSVADTDSIMQQISAEKGTAFETQHRLASGAVRDVEVFAGLLEVNGKRYVYGIIQDITEFKRAEKKLRESEALYRLVTRHMPGASVVMFDTDMRYILADGQLVKRTGYEGESLVGKTPRELFTEDECAFIEPLYKRALQGESFMYELIKEDYAYETYIAPVVDDSGCIIGGITLNHDITERVRAEKALRESAAMYRQLLEHLPNTSVIIFDLETRYTLAEGEHLKRFGPLYQDIVGKRAQDVLSGDSLKFIQPIYARALKGESFSFERVTEDHTYESHVSPLRDNNGDIIGGMILSHDISERKQAEKALHRSEELRRLFMQNMPNMAVFMFDNDMRNTLAEGPFLKRFGPVLENILGKTPQETLLPQDSKDFLVAVYRRILQGESFNFERVTNTLAYESFATPLRDSDGNIIGGMTLNHDITERKRAEKALREREELHRLFIQHMPNTSVIMFDNNRRFTLTEGDFLKRVGLISEKMVGKLPEDVFDEETLLFMQPHYERVLRGESFSYDRTTSNYAYQAYATPFRAADGQIIGGMFLSHDITEAKRAETALRVSEARFHSLVDLAPVGIIQTDALGKRVFCNTRWCEMTGITLEQALGDENYDTIYPDDLEFAASAWDNMIETHLPFDNRIFRYQRPDKTVIWVSGNGRPLYDTQGEITGYIGSVTDITEHKMLEEALLTSELRFRTLIDFAPVGIVEIDTQGEAILTNARWHTLSAVPETYASFDKASSTIHPDDLANIQAAYEAVMERADAIDNIEYRFVHPDGKVVWVSHSSRPLLDPNRLITGHIVTVTDITERKRLEEALRQNEERLRVITDNIQDLIIQSDADGQFVFVSPSARTILNIEPQSLINTSWQGLIAPEDIPLLNQSFFTPRELGEPYRVESRLRHADGHYISAETVGKLFYDAESRFTGGVFISRDISERKRMQDLLLEKERLQTALDKELELNNLKTRMMNRIAHEFRTPLTVIQATTETLTYYLDRLSQEQRDTKATTIKNQIQQLTNMLDEIGLVVKVDFTPDRVHRTLTDLTRLCKRIANQLEQELKLPGKFVLDLPDTTEVLVDPQVLDGALSSILHNAARFSESSAPVHVSLSRAEHSINLRVVDTGIGISPNEHQRIFEPFFRGSNIGESSGLGVGLTMTRSAIEAHGGTITIESVLKQGTTVSVWIPV